MGKRWHKSLQVNAERGFGVFGGRGEAAAFSRVATAEA